MKIVGKIKAFWHAHGTKFWGYFVIGIGILGDSLVYLQAIDPRHAAVYSLLVGVGGAIVKRGYTNSAQAPLPPPDPNASRP